MICVALRKLKNALENLEKDLAAMDDETFFAHLGTSIEELRAMAEAQEKEENT